MKSLKFLGFLTLFATLGQSVWANTKFVNVQGKLTDNSGNPLTGAYTITFRLYDNFTDPVGNAIWTENQSVITSTGNFNVTLGSVTALDSITFNTPYYLGMQVAGDSNELSPRQLLGASAYALGSIGNFNVGGNLISSTGTISSLTSTTITVTSMTVTTVHISTLTAVSSATISNLSITNGLNMSSNRIINIANGTASSDAAAFGQLYVGFQAPVYYRDTGADSTTSSSYVTTSVTASITPTSSAHRILILVSGDIFMAAANTMYMTVYRGSNDTASASGGWQSWSPGAAGVVVPISFQFIDSPGTTASTTYTVEIKNNSNGTNAVQFGGNSAQRSLTLIETN